ncbi:MAG: hypothetical protein RL518_501 [Pseudomonadota bacterium]
MASDAPISYSVSDLPFVGGVSYHLGISAEQLAPAVLLVGDPERVDLIADRFLNRPEFRVSHRGLTTCTGIARETGQRITVTTTGMGAPSTEIVLNELAALAEVDPQTLTRRSRRNAHLTLIRVGTSGALQGTTPLGTSIVSSHAVGLDSTAWFYGDGMTLDKTAHSLAAFVHARIEGSLMERHPSRGKIHPYGAIADTTIVDALCRAADECGLDHQIGATLTASGFFSPQGRDVSRVPPSVPDLDRLVAHDPRFLNMDMETAFVLHFCGALGYRAGALCVAAANRELNTFAENLTDVVLKAAQTAIVALSKVCSSPRV